MVATASAGKFADRDAVNAKYAATIPAICTALPMAIESRAKILRLALIAGPMVSLQIARQILS